MGDRGRRSGAARRSRSGAAGDEGAVRRLHRPAVRGAQRRALFLSARKARDDGAQAADRVRAGGPDRRGGPDPSRRRQGARTPERIAAYCCAMAWSVGATSARNPAAYVFRAKLSAMHPARGFDMKRIASALVAFLMAGCGGADKAAAPETAAYDAIIKGGTLYDGTGAPGVIADVAIEGDRIMAIGDLSKAKADKIIDATGMAVAPGFINMLSWAVDDLIEDGRSLGDLSQGVTLEVFGEGVSWGPLNDAMKADFKDRQSDIIYDIEWTTLGEYLDYLERRGVSPNVASFIGATSARIHEVGYDNRPATPEELARMQELVRVAMREGAMGVGSSLIYAPANFASTDELTALVAAAAEFDGMYISHIRSESGKFLEAVDEIIGISRATGANAEIYHFTASGRPNWGKADEAIAKIDAARADGVKITTDMYVYPASSTGLDAAMPLWVQEGGHDKWVERLKDPAIRARVIDEMRNPAADSENRLDHSGGPEGVLLLGFRNPALRKYQGMTLAAVAAERGTSPEDAAIDLVIEDDSRVQVAYFTMSEENITKT